MLNKIWFFMILISVIYSFFAGTISSLSAAFLSGCSDTVTFVLTFLGVCSLWLGVLEVAKESGLMEKISKILLPLIRLLFKDSAKNEKIVHAITMNVSANFLGLGNAATPFGIKAIEHMKEDNNNSEVATNDMITFLVLNTTCIQLIPSTLISLRIAYGSTNPGIIFIPVFLATLFSATFGMIIVKLFIWRNKKC